MAWWSWVVIWVVLCLLLVGMLAGFAWVLFRKSVAVLRELEFLASRAELLERADDVLGDQRAELAILADFADVRRRRERVRETAWARRADRRRIRLARAKTILAVDASQREWFGANNQHTGSKER